MSVEAYPLHWPPHRQRTKYRKRADFHRIVKQGRTINYTDGTTRYVTDSSKNRLTVGDSRDRVLKQLGMFGARSIVISSNLRLRQDGFPMSAQREPDDPGVAVYFQLNKQPHCLSCDTWDRAADNLAAIAKHVEAMRGQVRWGVADVAAMFAGFKALPGAIITPTMNYEQALQFIKQSSGLAAVGTDNIRDAFRVCALKFHPDRNNGVEIPEWMTFQSAKELVAQEMGVR